MPVGWPAKRVRGRAESWHAAAGEGRRSILRGWLLHRKALRAVGFGTGFQWIDGSFVEKGKEPK
ncbi:DUF6932 family protein, partial [Bradyrhizobium uaiense]|uniref:DUF6932 family protein n=1 Tax=Bradyrhizobium uaiense TaxID=2594946 RepID=UPI003D31A0A4